MAQWNKGRHIIWSSECRAEDWMDELREAYPNSSVDDLADLMYALNDEYLQDERINFSTIPVGNIVAIGIAGRWNGYVPAFRCISYGDLSKVLYPSCNALEIVWFVSTTGDLVCEETHHDAKNFWVFRELKAGVSEHQLHGFISKVLGGNYSRVDMNRISTRLGEKLAAYYGW